MRSIQSKKAFTLVELLVVIAIIGTLMGLLLPAVQSAREAGRRNTCTNNVSQLAKAVINHDGQKQAIPGWRNQPRITGGALMPSWPVMLLPYLERMDIYRLWEDGGAPGGYLSIFVCPTSPAADQTSPWICYAGNGGTGTLNATPTPDIPFKGDGVFFDAVGAVGTYSAVRMNLDVISGADGAANTLLFSEKCGSQTPALNIWSGTIGPIANNDAAMFACVSSSTTPPLFGVAGTVANIGTDKIVNPRNGGQAGVAPGGYHSRPTANHPSGVVAAFADGHTIFLKDSVARHVYAQLVTSDYRNSNPQRLLDPTDGWLIDPVTSGTYILQDGDY
jgi:prepilin-type N-terminal cleavage/methylation domain-containing protein